MLRVERLEDRCLFSTNNFWQAALGGSWNTPSNWSLGRAPVIGEIAVFDLLSSNQNCTIDTGVNTCDGLQINSNYTGQINAAANLTLGVGGYLQAGGIVNASNFSITVAGDWIKTAAAVFNSAAGTVNFNGSAGQNLDNAGIPFNILRHTGTGTLRLLSDPLTVAGTLTTSAGTFDASGLNVTISGLTTIISSSVVNSGSSSTLFLSGGLVMTGGTLSAGLGKVVLGADVTAMSASSGPATIGGNLDLGGVKRMFNVNSGPGSLDLIATAVISNGGITKNGAGVLELSNANAFALGTSINAGTLVVTTDQALGPGSGGTSVAAGAALGFSGGVTYGTTEPVTLNGGMIVSGNGSNTFAGPITLSAGGDTIVAASGSTMILNGAINPGDLDLSVLGTGDTSINGLISGTINATLAKQGAGTLTLTAANMYGGGTTIGGGTLAVGNDMAVCHGPLSLNNGTTIVSVGGGHTLANKINLGGAITVGGSNDLTFNGSINGSAGSFIQTDSGVLTLNAANSYGGGTSVSAGTLAVGNDNALGSGSLALHSGVTLISASTAHSFANAIILGGAVSVGGSLDLTLNGIISGNTGSLTQTDSGILTINRANTYAGGTTISASAGTLAIGNDNALGSGPLILNNGTTVVSAGASHILSNAVTLSGTVTVDGPNNLAFAGVLSGAGSLTKSGASFFTLSGNNSYTGTTTVTGGTLLVNGWQPVSAVVVSSSGTLGGTGTVGPIMVNGGTLSPGITGPGILASGDVQFNSGSTLVAQLNGPAAGPGFSQLAVNGTVTLGVGTTVLVLPGSYRPAPDSRFRIIDNLGTSPISGSFKNLPEGTIFSQNGVALQISYAGGSGNDVVLTTIPQKSDIAGRVSSTGQWWIGQSNGSAFTNVLATTWSTGVTWVDVHTGDFTGNGLQDIVGRAKETGQWWMSVPNGSGGFTTSLWNSWSTGVTWVDVKVGDFNGDGKMDIVGRALETGQWWVAQSTGSSFVNSLWTTWSTAVTWVDVNVGDFNGDGKADITGRVLQTGQWWTGISTGSSFNNSLWAAWSPNVTWVDVKVGDFNGDGLADITGRVLETGQWWTGISTGSSFNTSLWTTWSTAVTWVDVKVGDFNGDGMTDIVGRVLQTGQWWVGQSTGSSFVNKLWTTWSTAVTWVDVQVGDFNGDGKDDITGRVLETGQWWTGLSNGSAFTTSLWATWNPAANWSDVKSAEMS